MTPRDASSTCLVSAADFERWWRQHLGTAALYLVHPEVTRCLWCGSDDIDPRYAPMCSARCVVAAEVD